MENQLVGENTLKEVFPDLPAAEEFQEIFESFTEESDRFAVLVLRVDEFDKTLERLGENITSSLILNVARIVNTMSKTVPMKWGRMSQDEFGCLCPDMNEPSGLELAKKIQDRAKLTNKETVSIGLAVYPFWPFEKANILDNAQKALDHAAFFGPNTVTPFDAVSLNISADKLYQYGDIDGAVEEFKKALAVDPKNVNVHNSLGVCYGVQGKLDAAVKEFEATLRLDPEDVMATFNLGLARAKQGDQDKALELFLEAFRRDGDNPEVAYQIGVCYQEKNDIDTALEYLEKAAQHTPKGAHIYGALGECYQKKKMLREAVKAYEKAIKHNPLNAKNLSALGHLYGVLGENLEIAIVLCRESTVINPNVGVYHRRLGKLYLQNEDFENALKEFKMATRLGEDCSDLIHDTEDLVPPPADGDGPVDTDAAVDSKE